MTEGTLFVVATPIGNLSDLSLRARDVLAGVELIAAEDTRHTKQLLSHFGIATRLQSLHEHNELQLVPKLLDRLRAGQSIALVSDAGTPLISDPGYQLVAAAQKSGITVSPVPGPSALIAALSAAGLPTDRFCFEGFLPAKRAARRERIAAFAADPRTVVLFESVHRAADCLADLAQILGEDRPAFIGREISKQHEQCCAANLGVLKSMLDDGRIASRGEFVFVIAGAKPRKGQADDGEARRVLQMLMRELPGKKASRLAADILNRRPNETYRLMLALKKDAGNA
ncbi:MAG: 16S rRNA (cytidine(1402)-2'-O)-methyltransferase [Gammaproteobacteria bacterium]|nr:16S rRNA (cytidine(1402)-2'-O)-methyltransferase [Gammaproteobacteria bacterium]MDH4315165.1 16S rRNA (cytidine(1402)-2'-O)-methyltransferase [Gammaproteobacteria bacterium]MDH5213618.1 16S rRNA (cytidine(1402)-2'-O)-methyltransferase [Gammaproteobacteria bacterium]MDH5500400.1 16S rRNA (cytidine(1402)-2'-O)-methyltransferase [Gammaproteobacteria bacterium]